MTAFSCFPIPMSIAPLSPWAPPYTPILNKPPFPWISLWPVNSYQPPASSAEVAVWSETHRHCLEEARRLAGKILPLGQRHGSTFRDGVYVVALKRCYVQEIDNWLECGEWVCLSTGAYGRNLVELYVYVNLGFYQNAIFALAREANLLRTTGELRRPRQARHWGDERHPLCLVRSPHWPPTGYPSGYEICFYRNESDHNILRVIQWRASGGEVVRVYWTLLRHGGTECQWVEALPRPPYPLFGLELLPHQPEREVALIEDEFVAQELNSRLSDWVFCSVPGKLSNILDADLQPLFGRHIRVVLNQTNIIEGHRIHWALLKANVATVQFSVNIDDSIRSFDTLEDAATELGVALLPAPCDDASVDEPEIVITSAGEAIPDGSRVRQMVISPIISEGYLVWLYAEPKLGKTWLALTLAYAAARGNRTVCRWRTTDPIDVLYVDGEMLPDELQQSIDMIGASFGDQPGPPPFTTLCAHHQRDGVVDITSEDWQQAINDKLLGKRLLILDNFQSLTDNGPAALTQIRPWLRKLAREGITVIVVDHTNRDGELQGSVTKERIANLTIAMQYPDDKAREEGRILVEFPRARRLRWEDAQPFQVRRTVTDRVFTFSVIEDTMGTMPQVPERVLKMAKVVFARDVEKLTFEEIESAYGIAPSTAHGYYKMAKDLSGDERSAFEAEMHRLKTGREQNAS